MKNPISPSLKTEWFALVLVVLSFFIKSGVSFLYGPCLIVSIYALFIFFPYLKINHKESKKLREVWHKVKDLSLAYLFSVQIVIVFLFNRFSLNTIWILLTLWILFIWSLIPSLREVKKYRKKHGK